MNVKIQINTLYGKVRVGESVLYKWPLHLPLQCFILKRRNEGYLDTTENLAGQNWGQP